MGSPAPEVRRPAAEAPVRGAWSAAVLLLGVLGAIQTADPVVAALGLVRATEALGLSADGQALAASISTLALAATVVPAGVVADAVGRRRTVVLALLLAAAGDVLAAAAWGPLPFLAGRALAGVGLGAVFGGAFALVRDVVRPGLLPAALGVFAAMSWAPLFVLMPLGAALADSSWRAAFLVIPVAALASAALVPRLLPVVPALPAARREYWGLLALAVGIVGLLVALAGTATGLSVRGVLLPAAVGLVALALFAVVESRAAHPVFPMALFGNRRFLVGAIGGFVWNAAMAVVQLLSSNLWQYVTGLSALAASLRQLPIIAFAMVASTLTGRWIGRGADAVRVLVAGSAVTALGLLLAGFLAPGAAGVGFLVALCLVMFGCGVVAVPQGQLFVEEAPPQFYGPVTSSRTAVGQLSYAIGLAGGAALASAVATVRLVTTALPPPDPSLPTPSLPSGSGAAEHLVGRFLAGEAVPPAVGEAYAEGVAVALLVFSALVAVCTVAVLLLMRRGVRAPRRQS